MHSFILPYWPGIIFILFSFNDSIPSPDSHEKLKREIDSVNSVKYEFIISNINESINLFSNNLRKAESINYKNGEAMALRKLALSNYLGGNYENSTSEYIKAIKLYEESNDFEELAIAYGEFGYQLKRRDMTGALYYMRLAITIAREHHEDKTLVGLYDNYGVLMEMKEEIDSAMYYYKKALNMKYKAADSLGIPYSLNNIAGIYAAKHRFEDALRFLSLSDKYRNKQNGDFGKTENLSLRGDLLALQGKTDSAIYSYNKSLQFSIKINYKYLTAYNYQKLTELYSHKHDYKNALKNYEDYETYKDSISNEETNNRIAELRIKFETERKDRQIAQSELILKQKTLQISVLGGILFFMIIISIWIYKFQKQKRERIKNELELKSQLYKAEMESKIAEEKLRISKELHDNIGSQITIMISLLDNLTYGKEDDEINRKLGSISKFGRETLSELRNTIWAMKYEEGDVQQLILKINEIVQRLSNDFDALKINLINSITKTVKLSSIQMLNIYRIIQEFAQNSLKHSGCSELIICFDNLNDGFLLTLKDNGKGFDINNHNNGNGLKNMETRCAEAGGSFSINSCGTGTEINCAFNLN